MPSQEHYTPFQLRLSIYLVTVRRHPIVPMGSQSNALHLVPREPLLRSVVELRRAWTFMRCHFLRVFQRAAIGEIGGDPRRRNRLIADQRMDV